jgi:hypothetical protein
MLRWPGVVEAVGAPVAVQFRGGQAPCRPLAGVAGDGAEFRDQPAGRVEGQGVLVDPAPPGIFPRHRTLLGTKIGVVDFHPAQVPLLGPTKHPQPLGGVVGLPGRGPGGVLGQGQPIPGGLEVPALQEPALERFDLVSGRLPFVAGLLAGFLSLSRPLGGQA